MATVLLTWEQGAGLGHLMHLRPVAESLAHRGHRVFCAARDLPSARAAFGYGRISLLQAPVKVTAPLHPIRPTFSFAQILHNVGFGDSHELSAMAEAWRNLYELVRPDLIVFNHSPTALLAARGLTVKRALIGTGFTIPPDVSPLPNLCTWEKPNPEQMLSDEQRILGIMNDVLRQWDVPPLSRITQIYAEVDESFLMTFPELDHHPGRTQAQYWGAFDPPPGEAPLWPNGRGKQVFAYLKSFDGLPSILQLLRDSGHRTIVYVQPGDGGLQSRFGSESLRITDRPVDLNQAARQCDLAILNATHASTVCMLLAGKPVLELPIYLEQMILARRVAELGMGLEAEQTKIHDVAARLQQLLSLDRYAAAARRFSMEHAGFDGAQQLQKVIERLDELLAN